MIQLTKKEWFPIWEQIRANYPKSVWMISTKLKSTLGFAIRYHTEPDLREDIDEWYSPPKVTVCLDFYDDAAETMFRLKYL